MLTWVLEKFVVKEGQRFRPRLDLGLNSCSIARSEWEMDSVSERKRRWYMSAEDYRKRAMLFSFECGRSSQM